MAPTQEVHPPAEAYLDRLADLLAEKYFDRMDDRLKKIPELRRLITVKEASQYLSLSTETVYRMASLKKLPYIKVGGRLLFDVKALDRWIDKHMIKEKEWKKEELKAEIEEHKENIKGASDSDLLGFLKKKGRE